MTTRTAVVKGGSGRVTRERVEAYLPSPGNYRVEEAADGTLRIVGEDSHGWTLHGYVIPRLASGGIVAAEETLDDIVAAARAADMRVLRDAVEGKEDK